MKHPLSPQTFIGEVELTIQDLDRSLRFYTQILGFHLREKNDHRADLGTEETTLLRLFENPQAKKYRATTGLYHFAILVPRRQILAKALKNLIETQTPLQGVADHGVSEAIYLPDPDSNGIEIYRDRPYQEWPFKNGELQMATDPLDLANLLLELNGSNAQQTKLPADTTIGHIHLHVRDIPEAVTFYRDILGFDLKQRYGPSAAFLAAGNYHHHIGINTWAGIGAPPPPEDSVGLRSFTIILPKPGDLENLRQKILRTDYEMVATEGSFSIIDPSGNRMQFEVAQK